MKSIFKFSVILFLIIELTNCIQPAKKEVKQPNIIYVLADDMGYGDVKALNPDCKISTPNLDKLTSDGIYFTDAHTSSSVCTPTRYGILTGRYNWRSTLKNGVLWGTSPALIEKERETVASLLKKAGYYTAYIGKWHLGWNWGKDENGEVDFTKPVTHNPNDLGFDYAYGHVASLDIPPYVYVENGLVTAQPDTMTENKSKYSWWRNGHTGADFVHEDVTPNFFRRSIKLIKEKAGQENPFFLYLPLPSPHTPILPTEEWQEKSGLNPYGDFVMMIDDYMGKLVEATKEMGIEENTLIIFTTDNGCSPEADFDILGEKGHNPSYIYRGHKADIYEGGHRVPFIVKWPAKISGGIKSNKTICTTDLMATCAEIAGAELADNAGEDSFSMLPLFGNPESEDFSREATVHHSINGSFAIRKGDWKLNLCPGSGGWSDPKPNTFDANAFPPFQLYNLKDNPEETVNLFEQNPEKVAELKELLKGYILNGRSTPGVPQKNDEVKEWKQISFI